MSPPASSAAPICHSLKDDYQIALVLGGGNALGAYHAGLYEALTKADLLPDWIVGASIGAIVGGIIAGNVPEERLPKLRQLWRPADNGAMPLPWNMLPEAWRRSSAALETMLTGRRGLFGPLGSGATWLQDTHAATSALYNTRELPTTLSDLIDFDLLNSGQVRFTATAVDVETGEDVCSDTASMAITVDHIRASAALLSAFPAVEVEGRLLGDAGLSMNLPLDPVLALRAGKPVLCIASDLLPLLSGRPETLGEAIGRTQDLIFAAQTRRTIAHWERVFAAQAEPASITLATVSYSDQDHEVAGKAMDFSPQSVRRRWERGRQDGLQLLQRLEDAGATIGLPGLKVISAQGG